MGVVEHPTLIPTFPLRGKEQTLPRGWPQGTKSKEEANESAGIRKKGLS